MLTWNLRSAEFRRLAVRIEPSQGGGAGAWRANSIETEKGALRWLLPTLVTQAVRRGSFAALLGRWESRQEEVYGPHGVRLSRKR